MATLARSGSPGAALALVALTCACGPIVKQAAFSERPETVRPGSLLGPFEGRVVERDTGRPIEGALVRASWLFERGIGSPVAYDARTYPTATDPDGRYVVPRLRDLPAGLSARLARFTLTVYRKGFVIYRSDRVFSGARPRIDFAQYDNLVRLARWSPGMSHARHLLFGGGHLAFGPAMAEERAAAAAELARGEDDVPGEDQRPALAPDAPEPAPDAREAPELLSEDDVREVTGFSGRFVRAPLNDPSDATSTAHFRAVDKPERFDVAVRLWRLEPDALAEKFEALKQTLPQVRDLSEPGDRAFMAAQDDIRGLGFLDAATGSVVLLTCGTDLCRSEDHLSRLARRVAERLSGEAPASLPSEELLPLEDDAASEMDAE